MRLRVLCISVVNIIRRHQRNIKLLAQPDKCHIDRFLVRYPVILKLQEIVASAKAVQVFQNCIFCFLIKPLYDKPRNLSGKTCRQRNNALMVLPQYFHIHTRLVIIALCKAFADNFHEIRIALIIFCKQNKMVIPFLTACRFLIKS